jgi:bifunctional aspartokinase / homoserine dehydrogenase 1
MPLITMKFGGTSMGSGDAISKVANIIQSQHQNGDELITCVSAMSGMTDALLKLARLAGSGDTTAHLGTIAEMRVRHHTAARELVTQTQQLVPLLTDIDALLNELSTLCHSLAVLGEASPRALDRVASFGERLSARLLAGRLRQLGITAAAVDATEIIVTDDNFTDASPLMKETRERIHTRLLPMVRQREIPVVTGFIGATHGGQATTLGRGGSDFSAAILGACADTDELWIYTDVDGVMTTDPRLASAARVLPVLSYAEVAELAYFGAKVLHPKTVQPIVERGVPLRVRNTFNPEHPGTLVQPTQEVAPGVIKAVSIIKDVALLNVEGRGMIGVPGIAGRTFTAVARAQASILMISQASSEQSITCVLPANRIPAVIESITQELQVELERQDVERIEAQHDIVIVTAVGAGLRDQVGVAARVLTAIAEANINIIAMTQGSSECSLSMVVLAKDGPVAVNALHELVLETLPLA